MIITLVAIARNITMEVAKYDINLHMVHITGKMNTVNTYLGGP